MRPLLITARLGSGFAANDPWSPSIDGVLAWSVMRERIGMDEMALNADVEPVEGLPLDRIEHGGWWWYAASSPIYETAAEVERPFHRRFDVVQAERLMAPPRGKLNLKAGPYKNLRRTDLLKVTDRIQWHVVGDADEVRRLLRCVTHLGGGRARGRGPVVEWEVSEDGANETKAWLHRPVPMDYAIENGIQGIAMTWSVRPPFWWHGNKTFCMLPRSGHAVG